MGDIIQIPEGRKARNIKLITRSKNVSYLWHYDTLGRIIARCERKSSRQKRNNRTRDLARSRQKIMVESIKNQ